MNHLHIPRLRQRKPTTLPTVSRTTGEKVRIALAIVYIAGLVVLGLDLFVWRH